MSLRRSAIAGAVVAAGLVVAAAASGYTLGRSVDVPRGGVGAPRLFRVSGAVQTTAAASSAPAVMHSRTPSSRRPAAVESP